MSVTDGDRARAAALLSEWGVQRTDEGALSVTAFVYVEDWRDAIAEALAEEQEKARAPFLALAEKHVCGEVGNAFGGYNCAYCDEPWLYLGDRWGCSERRQIENALGVAA